jgi:hypothetical protein
MFGTLLRSLPFVSGNLGSGYNKTIPSRASRFFLVSKNRLFMIKPEILTSAGLSIFAASCEKAEVSIVKNSKIAA